MGARLSGGFADYQFGINLDAVGKLFMREFLEQGDRGLSAHLLERLADGGEARNDVGGSLDVVEAEDGDVFRDFETCIVEGSDAADGGDVVEAEQGGKVFALEQKLLRDRVAKRRGVEVFVELDDEIVGDFEREGLCDLHGGLPAALRV